MTVPKLRAPIVLIHGLLGYDQIAVCGIKLAAYFPGIPELLEAGGNRVLIPRLYPVGSVAERAAQLKAFIDRESPNDPVHLIAHSMGGLDARYMITKLEMAGRVLTLTTIATPHRGTPFADWGIRRFSRVLKPVLDYFSLSYQAFYDLTTTNCGAFNEAVPNVPVVRYFSVAGRFEGDWLDPQWQLPQRIVTAAEGPNDGVVSLTSAHWGEYCDVLDGENHLSLVNWPNRSLKARGLWQDRAKEYGRLVARLKEEGF